MNLTCFRHNAVSLLPLLLCIASLNGCRRPDVAPGLPAPPPPKAGVSRESAQLKEAKLAYKDPKGNTLWSVTAKEGTGEVSSMTAVLKEVKCIFYADNKPAWTCRADTLTAEQPTKEIQMTGNVTGSSADGQRSFTAPSAKWDVKSDRLTGGPSVTFRMGGVVMTGDRLIASTKETKGKVIGHVQGRILKADTQR